MKKLLIKVVCLLLSIMFAISMVGCTTTEDTASSLTTSESLEETTSSLVESEEEQSSMLDKQPSISEFDEQMKQEEETEESAPVASEAPEVQTEDVQEEAIEPVEVIEPEESIEPAEALEAEPVEEEEEVIEESYSGSPRLYEPSDFSWMGVLNWNGWRWTYYSQRVLPGGGLNIPGRHVDADGYVCDENNYICLASSTLAWGTIVDTPLGKPGRVYDSGCAADVLDVYVDW